MFGGHSEEGQGIGRGIGMQLRNIDARPMYCICNRIKIREKREDRNGIIMRMEKNSKVLCNNTVYWVECQPRAYYHAPRRCIFG